MSGPLLSTELARAGVSPVQSKAIETDKKAKDREQVAFGDDDDGSKTTGEAAAKNAKKQSAKESSGSGGGEKVKRKRVKLKDLAEREVGKEYGGRETDKASKTTKAAQARAKMQAQEGQSLGEGASLSDQAKEAAQARNALGIKKASGFLMQQSRLNQASVKYETARNAQDSGGQQGLSKTGQQKWMLNCLIGMTNICVEQHTGGKAGEAYESRRDNRLIHMALRGLRDGNQKTETGSGTSRTGMSRGEYESKRLKAQSIFANIIEPAVRPEHLPEYSEVA